MRHSRRPALPSIRPPTSVSPSTQASAAGCMRPRSRGIHWSGDEGMMSWSRTRSRSSRPRSTSRMGQRYLPGDETWYASDAPVGSYSVVFEDDGETGYFYAVERRGDQPHILDAVQIYAVRNVVDREIPSHL